MKQILLAFFFLPVVLFAQTYAELKRYKAPEAKQGVVAGKDYFIVFSNDTLAKYDKTTGYRLAVVYDERLIHMNSGMLKNGKLYCAHSNYPDIPMWSSIETWDEKTLKHLSSHSFGIENGSCTWMDIFNGYYYVFFAHYANAGKMEPNRDVSWSQLVKYDKQWRRVEAWVLPPALVERLTPYSLSGGVITADGNLLCTHHHNMELYVLSFPAVGSELVWKATIPSTIPGQAIAIDALEKNILWGISRTSMEVIKAKLILTGE